MLRAGIFTRTMIVLNAGCLCLNAGLAGAATMLGKADVVLGSLAVVGVNLLAIILLYTIPAAKEEDSVDVNVR